MNDVNYKLLQFIRGISVLVNALFHKPLTVVNMHFV